MDSLERAAGAVAGCPHSSLPTLNRCDPTSPSSLHRRASRAVWHSLVPAGFSPQRWQLIVDDRQDVMAGATTLKAFGLTISSCIHCPELSAGSGAADVAVRYGEVPQNLPGATQIGVRYQATSGRLLFEVDRIARFLVCNGNEVVIDRHPDATDDEVRLFLLGSGFGAILHQRGILALHGSTVKVDDACVVFLGRSGMGKSTLATVLSRRGYPCLGDDVCAVSIGEDGVPNAAAAYPQAKLWLDSLRHFGFDPTGLRRIRPSLEKRAVPLAGFSAEERVPVKRLYVLSRPTNGETLLGKPLTGPLKIRILRDYTYRVDFLQGLNRTLDHFQQISHLAMRLPVARLYWSRGEMTAEHLADAVEEDFRA
jgi:hypothetical protein